MADVFHNNQPPRTPISTRTLGDTAMTRRNKRDQGELRDSILSGEEVQITLRRETYYDDKKQSWLTTRAVAELRCKGKNGQWFKAPEMVCLNQAKNVDDAGSLLRDFTHWLEAGRVVEVESDPPELAAALAAIDAEDGD